MIFSWIKIKCYYICLEYSESFNSLILEVVVPSNCVSCIMFLIVHKSLEKCERKGMGGFELKSIWVNIYK